MPPTFEMQFHISPRCAPAAIVARRLGLTEAQFAERSAHGSTGPRWGVCALSTYRSERVELLTLASTTPGSGSATRELPRGNARRRATLSPTLEWR